MIYFARITKGKGGVRYLVEFPDLPGCNTDGNSRKQALKNAKELLDVWLAAHCDTDRVPPFPVRRRGGKGLYPILVDFRVEVAIRLRDLRKSHGLTQLEMARRLAISLKSYCELETLLKDNDQLLDAGAVFPALNDPSKLPSINFRGIRAKTGLTQVEIADRLGLSQAEVSKLENGKCPIGKALAKRIENEFDIEIRPWKIKTGQQGPKAALDAFVAQAEKLASRKSK